jgi:hypothetical protein
MNNVNYSDMSDKELEQYFLRNRNDKVAMQVYIDRLAQRPQQIVTTLNDPDFYPKIEAAVLRQLQSAGRNDESTV